MKKLLIIFILLIPVQLLAQKPIEIQTIEKGNISGLMYLANDKTIIMNQDIINFLTAKLSDIISIGGKTTISIPISKEFKKRLRIRFVDGYLCQYAYTGSNVSLQKPKTKYKEFDFSKKTIKDKTANDDNDDPFKPSDTKLKEKIKQKDEKENKKPGTQIKPGK